MKILIKKHLRKKKKKLVKTVLNYMPPSFLHLLLLHLFYIEVHALVLCFTLRPQPIYHVDLTL